MSTKSSIVAGSAAPTSSVSLTPKQAAGLLNLSVSWLAKRRLAGDGPVYVKMGGAVRYSEAALQQWMKSRQRISTSES
jgi:predicted DNA-binding transcriptional regulator AlpA